VNTVHIKSLNPSPLPRHNPTFKKSNTQTNNQTNKPVALPRKARKDLQVAKDLFTQLLVDKGTRALYATVPDNRANADTSVAPEHTALRRGSVAGTVVPKRRGSAVARTVKVGFERKRYAKLLRLFEEPAVNSRHQKPEMYKPFSTAELRVNLF